MPIDQHRRNVEALLKLNEQWIALYHSSHYHLGYMIHKVGYTIRHGRFFRDSFKYSRYFNFVRTNIPDGHKKNK